MSKLHSIMENTAIKYLLYLLHNVWNNNFGIHTSRNKIIKKYTNKV